MLDTGKKPFYMEMFKYMFVIFIFLKSFYKAKIKQICTLEAVYAEDKRYTSFTKCIHFSTKINQLSLDLACEKNTIDTTGYFLSRK